MNDSWWKEVEALRAGPKEVIRRKYRELFGEEPRSQHRQSLVRQIAWRLQANAEGGLSERARQHALKIADDADVRFLAPRSAPESRVGKARLDRRIPPVGTVLSRDYRGSTISVKVLATGFEYQERKYRSLSAIAAKVTGTRWNGLAFFGLTGERSRGAARATRDR